MLTRRTMHCSHIRGGLRRAGERCSKSNTLRTSTNEWSGRGVEPIRMKQELWSPTARRPNRERVYNDPALVQPSWLATWLSGARLPAEATDAMPTSVQSSRTHLLISAPTVKVVNVIWEVIQMSPKLGSASRKLINISVSIIRTQHETSNFVISMKERGNP